MIIKKKNIFCCLQTKNKKTSFHLNRKFTNASSLNKNSKLRIPQQNNLLSIYSTHYKKTICQDLIYKNNIKNMFTIPKISKITLSVTYKAIVNDKKNLIPGLTSLMLISGKKLKYTFAKKSIAGFKLRQNQIIGCKVSLRNKDMYNFLDKLVMLVLPRIKNFTALNSKKLSNATNANLDLGLNDIFSFPELENYFNFFELINGINVNIITTSNTYKYKITAAKKKNLNTHFSGNCFSQLSKIKFLKLNLLSAFMLPSGFFMRVS